MGGFPLLDRVARLMDAYPRPWGFCGGWALDLFLDRTTRSHGDVDIAIMREDQRSLQEYLTSRGWFLEVSNQGLLAPWTEGQVLEPPLGTIWASNQAFDPSFIEVLLQEGDGEHVLFGRDPSIAVPLRDAFVRTPAGVPVLAPELVLLYQAADTDAGIPANLKVTLQALGHRRRWLRMAVAKLDSNHLWLEWIEER